MKEQLKTLEDLNEEFRKNNIPQKVSGDELNDLWEEKLRKEAYWRGSLKGCEETKKEILDLVNKKIEEYGDIRPLREIKQYLEE